MAYRLQLPDTTWVYPVFHVSLLKPAVESNVVAGTLPIELDSEGPPFLLELALQGRDVVRDGVRVEQVLVKWIRLREDEAAWLDGRGCAAAIS